MKVEIWQRDLAIDFCKANYVKLKYSMYTYSLV